MKALVQTPPAVQLRVEAIRLGLVHVGRGFGSLLAASRLPDALAYVLAVVFILMPISWLGQALNWALARPSPWVGLVTLILSASVLVFFAALMINEQFLKDVQAQGVRWPSLLSVALAWLAVLVFGGLSCGLERMGTVQINPSVPVAEGCATRYADFYLWHLLDSVPGLKIPETIGWVQRYTYTDPVSGWLLLAFKGIVIVCVIGSFVVCGKLRREAEAAKMQAKSTAV